MGRAVAALRRRQRRRLVQPPHPDRLQHPGHAQPVPPGVLRLDRRPVRQMAQGRQRAARQVPRGAHRLHRLPLGRGPDPPAPGAVGRGRGRGRRTARHLRPRELLRRGHGPRHRHREARPLPGPRDRAPDERAPGGHQRLPLREEGGPQDPGRPPVHQLGGAHQRPRPLQVRRRRLLHPLLPGDARAVEGAARRLRRHPGDRRALRRPLHHHEGGRQLHARLPRPRGRGQDLLVRQGGRAGAQRPLPGRHPRRRARTGAVRGGRHHLDGLPRLLPHRRRLHQLGQVPGDPRGAGARLGRGLDGRLRDEDHRAEPLGARAHLRALPQPGAHLDARLRRRLRRAPARRGDRLRQAQVRRGPHQPGRHLRDDQDQAGPQGLGAHPGQGLQDGRAAHQGAAPRHHGQGHLRGGDLRPGRQALRGGRRVPQVLRGQPRHPRGRPVRPRPGGAHQAVGRARLRGDHELPHPHRHHPHYEAPPGRGHHHPVRLPDVRDAGPAEDGLPGPAQPHGRVRRAGEHRDQREGGPRPRPHPLRRREDLRAAGPGRHPGGLPARRRRHARPAQAHEARQLRGHLRRGRPLPPRPHGRELAHELRAAQERAPGDHAHPPGAGRAARGDPGDDLRFDRLPGAGHADRPETGGLHPGAGRHPPQGYGQEEEGGPGPAVQGLPPGDGRQRLLGGVHQGPVGRGRPLLRLRVQQGALRRLRPRVVLDGLPQGELPDRVHGRPADLDEGQQGPPRPVPGRVPPHGHHRAAPRRERLDGQLRP